MNKQTEMKQEGQRQKIGTVGQSTTLMTINHNCAFT